MQKKRIWPSIASLRCLTSQQSTKQPCAPSPFADPRSLLHLTAASFPLPQGAKAWNSQAHKK
jgi:hypothetical protein